MQQTTLFDTASAHAPESLSVQRSNLPKDWHTLLADPALLGYWQQVDSLLGNESAQQQTVFPGTYFTAMQLTPMANVKVVILGQDPYHGEGEAHGLAFSVRPGVKVPPSLRNIFKELQQSGELSSPPAHGDLSAWATQGVLLLNTVLSVRKDKAGSHRGHGWEQITDHVIQALATRPEPTVFMLWGSDAIKKQVLIPNHQLVLTAPHPSPLSAYRGFFGCGHFQTTNQWLIAHNQMPINWSLTA